MQRTSSVVRPRRCLAGLALAATLLCAPSPRAAPSGALLDPAFRVAQFTVVDPAALEAGARPVKSEPFRAQPGMGSVWVMVYFVGALVDPSRKGETLFSVGLADVPMAPRDTVLGFESRHMRQPDRRLFAGDGVQGFATPVGGVAIRAGSGPAHERLAEAMGRPGVLRHLAALKVYHVPPGAQTEAVAAVVQSSNMRPLMVEVVAGQGSVPREIEAFVESTNGSWLWRYRHETAALATLLAAGFLLLRRLWRQLPPRE